MTRYPSEILEVVINGKSLTIEEVVAVARLGAKVVISDEGMENMRTSRVLVENLVENGDVVYGISTGFGDFSTVNISKEDLSTLQENLIISHAVAVGTPYPDEVVRGIMLLRANAICIGNSGARPLLVETIVAMLNKGVHPVIPEKGSLGASGDLAPLSHMVLPMLGRGEASYNGEVLSGKEAMARAGIETVSLVAKEGLALINGTQAMTSVGTLAYYDANCAAKVVDNTRAMTMEALTGRRNAFDQRVQAIETNKGQVKGAKKIRLLNEGRSILSG